MWNITKMRKRFIVRKNERGLLLREGDFAGLLNPGVSYHMDPMDRLKLQVLSLENARFDHALVEYLRRCEPDVIAAQLHRVDVGEHEAVLRSEDGVLVEIIPPRARRLYWREPVTQTFETFDIGSQLDVPAALVARLHQSTWQERKVQSSTSMLHMQVSAGQVGVLKVDGVVARLLEPGPAAFWRFNREVAVEMVDTRLQALEVSGQEILTRDKVAVRINLSANWRFRDVLLAFAQLPKPADHLYRELQFGLRAAVGTRTLDELLANKELINQVVLQHLQAQMAETGMDVLSVGVKDIVLPGDMKALLGRVVEATKVAEANVIRRREETAATRSLLNTAKVLEDNPVALRLKELETLERIAERIDRISVFGGLDQVLNGLIQLNPEKSKAGI